MTKTNAAQVVINEWRGPAGMSKSAYFDQVRGRLPTEHRRGGDAVSRVNRHYVETARDDTLSNSFSKFVAWTTADQAHGLAGKGDIFYVTGESGAGKTKMVEHLIAEHPVLKPMETPIGIVSPIISISLAGPATPKAVALAIFKAAGDEVDATGRKIQESMLWLEMPAMLEEKGIMFVHIDEFQHMFYAGVDHEALVEYFKGLMNHTQWPVSFIFGGMPAVRNIIINDQQANRRNNSFTLPSIEMPGQVHLVEQIVKEYGAEVQMDVDGLIKSDMPKRIAHAANYQFGRVCEVVATAIQEAAAEEARTLTRKHFALAYVEHSDARGRDEMNPFISKDWKRLKPGYFILKPQVSNQSDHDEYDDE